MIGKVAAGIVKSMCEAAELAYAIPRPLLLEAALLDAQDLRDGTTLLPSEALSDLLLFVREHTGDAAAGVRLGFALDKVHDLRTQGFFGYALLSSLTLRQRLELHVRYQNLGSPSELSYRIEGKVGVAEFAPRGFSGGALPVFIDCTAVLTVVRFKRFFQGAGPTLELWLSIPEQPHHRELRALVAGPVVFDARCNRLQFPAAALDLKLGGDPHLHELVCTELDARLAEENAPRGDFLKEVRERVGARLDADASVTRVARDLRVSTRSLQRRLGELGVSFQQLVEEIRHQRAVTYLVNTDEAIERVAERLGYTDPSSFRRAFRRWTGMAPALFRSAQRRHPPEAVRGAK